MYTAHNQNTTPSDTHELQEK